jgi:hypothetical protein
LREAEISAGKLDVRGSQGARLPLDITAIWPSPTPRGCP